MKLKGIPVAMMMACAAFFASCDTKTPEACFQPSENMVDQNEDVTFSNCSIYQEAGYAWDFGDGNTSNEVYPTHKFTSRGEFLVTLTSLGKTASRNDTYSEIIKVGARKLSQIEVNTIPATDGQGNPWDASDPADVKFLFIQGGTVQMQTVENTDMALAAPYLINFTTLMLDLTPDVWTIAMVDVDGLAVDTMATMTIDLAAYIPNDQQEIVDDAANADWVLNYILE